MHATIEPLSDLNSRALTVVYIVSSNSFIYILLPVKSASF